MEGATYLPYASNNAEEVQRCCSENLPVYCLYCAQQKDPKRIVHYTYGCAQCYHCGVDAIIPDPGRFTQIQLDVWREYAFDIVVDVQDTAVVSPPPTAGVLPQ